MSSNNTFTIVSMPQKLKYMFKLKNSTNAPYSVQQSILFIIKNIEVAYRVHGIHIRRVYSPPDSTISSRHVTGCLSAVPIRAISH